MKLSAYQNFPVRDNAHGVFVNFKVLWPTVSARFGTCVRYKSINRFLYSFKPCRDETNLSEQSVNKAKTNNGELRENFLYIKHICKI